MNQAKSGAGSHADRDLEAEPPSTALPAALLPEGGGWIVAWAGPHGSACVRVERLNEVEPQAIELSAGASTEAPHLFWLGERLAAITCDAEGAWLTLLDRSATAVVRKPQLLRAGARRVAVAAGTRSSHVFVAGSDTITAIAIDASGEIDRGAEPLIEHGSRPLIAACRAGATSLVLATFAGEHRLHVGSPGGGARGVVRHQLGGEARSLSAYGAGSRAAFAVSYASNRSVVEAGIVGADARMLERRDVVLRGTGADFSQLDVTWIEDDFHLLARDAASGQGTLIALRDRKVLLTFPRAPDGFACAYYRKRIAVIGTALQSDDDIALKLVRAEEDGASAGTFDLRIRAPLELGGRQRIALADRCLAQAAASLGGTGYRGASVQVRTRGKASALTLVPERARLCIELRPDDSFRISLLVSAEGHPAPDDDDAEADTPRDGPFERMGKWIRERLHPGERARGDAHRTRAKALQAELQGGRSHIEDLQGALRLEVDVPNVPRGAELARWAQRAVDTLREPLD